MFSDEVEEVSAVIIVNRAVRSTPKPPFDRGVFEDQQVNVSESNVGLSRSHTSL